MSNQGRAMPVASGKIRIAITLPESDAEWLRQQADRECRTSSSLINHLIRRYRDELTGDRPQ